MKENCENFGFGEIFFLFIIYRKRAAGVLCGVGIWAIDIKYGLYGGDLLRSLFNLAMGLLSNNFTFEIKKARRSTLL